MVDWLDRSILIDNFVIIRVKTFILNSFDGAVAVFSGGVGDDNAEFFVVLAVAEGPAVNAVFCPERIGLSESDR